VTERSSQFQRSPARDYLLDLLATAPAEGIGIAAILNNPGIGTRGAADMLLMRMVKAGEIERPSRGRYALASQISTPAAPQREKPDHVHRPAEGLRHPRDLAEPIWRSFAADRRTASYLKHRRRIVLVFLADFVDRVVDNPRTRPLVRLGDCF